MDINYEALMLSKSFLPFRMGYLTDWMVKLAEEELNETKETRAKALAELRTLIAKEKNFDIWTDDSYLLQFLRVRKFDPVKAMKVIRNLYTVFKSFPDIYPKDLDVGPVVDLLKMEAAGPFNYRHKDGAAVFFVKSSNWDPDQTPAELVSMAVTAVALRIAEDPATQVCGAYLVYDAEFRFRHLREATPKFIKLFSTLLNNTVPIRFKAIHVVNESPVFRHIFSILKMFLSDKIKKRIFFHGRKLEELHKHIPKEILSPLFGGDDINYSSIESCGKAMKPFADRFSEMLRRGYS